MARVRFSKSARRDIGDITAQLLEVSVVASDRYEAKFDAVFGLLAQMPRAGRPRPELGLAWLRSYPVDPYVILYRVDRGFVTVLRVVHGARDLASLIAADPGL